MPGKGRPLPKRYAQAVFQLALEQDRLEGWGEDLQAMAEAAQDVRFAALLDSPGVKLQDKLQAAGAVLPDLGPLARNLLGLLAQRRAAALLPRVLEEYLRLVDQRKGVQRVEVVSAVPLIGSDQERVARHLAELLGMEVVVQPRVQPGIIGGLVFKVGDRVIDGSTRNHLEELRKTLVEVG